MCYKQKCKVVSLNLAHHVCPDELTRSQAVARIADRTASQHLWGHVMLSVTWPFDSPCHFLLVVFWNQASISNGFWDIHRRM